MGRLFELLEGMSARLWGSDGTSIVPWIQPSAPYDRSALLAPALVLGGFLSMVAFSGLGIAALGILVLSLLGLYLVLTELFGITIEVRPEAL